MFLPTIPRNISCDGTSIRCNCSVRDCNRIHSSACAIRQQNSRKTNRTRTTQSSKAAKANATSEPQSEEGLEQTCDLALHTPCVFHGSCDFKRRPALTYATQPIFFSSNERPPLGIINRPVTRSLLPTVPKHRPHTPKRATSINQNKFEKMKLP
mmetsp:Transcript_32775/g.101507  ORF Transcript_32775/g.101507 Transcript_32775/m.101507 type:complete len:154 (-) Transcript_32775:1502-1963(-)